MTPAPSELSDEIASKILSEEIIDVIFGAAPDVTPGDRPHQDDSEPRPVTSDPVSDVTPSRGGQQGDSGIRTVTSAAKRMRRMRARQATEALLYQRDDWQLFLDLSTLPQKAGCQPGELPRAVLKEVVDNALDSGAASVSLESIRYDDGIEYVVSDDGPGIDPERVPELFSVNRPLLSSKLKRMPLRGMLGNGLRVVAGAVAATEGTLIVESRGYRLSLATAGGATEVALDEPIPTGLGTTVRIKLGCAAKFDGSEAAHANLTIAIAGFGKQYTGSSSPHWYCGKDLHRLFQHVMPESMTVGDVVRDLGFELEDDRPARSLSQTDALQVLDALQSRMSPVPPEALGFIGNIFENHSYARKTGVAMISGARIPYVVECLASCSRVETVNDADVDAELWLNRSPSLSRIYSSFQSGAIKLLGCGTKEIIKVPKGDYDLTISVIAPHLQLENDGKSPALGVFRVAIRDAVEKAAKAAHRNMERPVGVMTIIDAAASVMEAAYAEVSDHGRLPAQARQMYYKARPELLRLTGKKEIKSSYFTQTVLPDYVKSHPEETKDWDIVWDARGHFREPHTHREFPLSILDVREYLGFRPRLGPVELGGADARYPTIGPKNRFRNVLFIEKEGFDPLIQAVGIAEKYDLAIMSTKGMSVVAARFLLDQLAPFMERVFVLHDFDVSGFSIFGTLGSTGRRYTFKNNVELVDLGLRLADIAGLETEKVDIKGDWEKRAQTLREHGAIEEEIEFLKDQRVELNAMSSLQFIGFIERKLIEHGVDKLIPGDEAIKDHARRLTERQLSQNLLATFAKDIADGADTAANALPPNIKERIQAELQRDPTLSWDMALANILPKGGAL